MNRLEFLQQLLLLPLTNFFRTSTPKEKVIYSACVAGFQYYEGNKILQLLSQNDVLTLSRQPNNRYDERAIEIFWKSHKIGYIPMADNLILANMLDSGIALQAKIKAVKPQNPDWKKVKVNVYLES